MKFRTIKFEEVLEGIGQLTLNRPDRLNAINMEMLDELYALFMDLQNNDDIRVVIITGAGRGFCSGADIKDDALAGEEGLKLFANSAIHIEKVQRKYSRIIIAMRRIPQPIIAAVNGASAGGGFSMALASDIIFANSKAAFTASFVNIGLSGGELGTSYFLPRMVGISKASEILMTGRTVYADEAEQIGLISRQVKDEELLNEALKTAGVLLGKSRLGLKFTKEAIRLNINAPSLEAAVELEDRNQSICCCSPDFFEAVISFANKEKG
jgi:enoyl-CoA hydratase